ncbi:hypothetical protein JTB14_022255 [Gonioctena quinquepunctata]|nr:hypothetical protein JTB14_022255 [Gonioctena quinquepunctata]
MWSLGAILELDDREGWSSSRWPRPSWTGPKCNMNELYSECSGESGDGGRVGHWSPEWREFVYHRQCLGDSPYISAQMWITSGRRS